MGKARDDTQRSLAIHLYLEKGCEPTPSAYQYVKGKFAQNERWKATHSRIFNNVQKLVALSTCNYEVNRKDKKKVRPNSARIPFGSELLD